MSSSKKFICKGTLRQVFFCLRPIPPPHTVYMYTTVYLFTQGRRELWRVEPESRLEGQQFTGSKKLI
jgi:hypothetical protein